MMLKVQRGSHSANGRKRDASALMHFWGSWSAWALSATATLLPSVAYAQAPAPMVAPRSVSNYLPLSTPHQDESVPLIGNDRWGLYPRVGTSFVYDDNITLLKTNKLDDLILSFSPGVTLVIGETSGNANADTLSIRGLDSSGGGGGIATQVSRNAMATRGLATTTRGISLDYVSAFNYFVSHSSQNSVDHVARLNGVLPLERLKLSLQQDVQALSDAVLDVGTRIRRRTYGTDVNAGYDVSDLTRLNLGGRQTISDFQDNGLDSRDWTAQGSLDHQISPRLSLGVGGGYGVLNPDPGSSQSYQQMLLRAAYAISDRLKANMSGGYETRDLSGQASKSSSWVFSGGASYVPNDQLQLNLITDRRNQSSALFVGQNYTRTSVGLQGTYRPTERLAFYSGVAYNLLAYESTTSTVQGRNDTYYAAQVGTSFDIALRWVFGIYFQWRSNSSTLDNFDYDGRQLGMTLSWAY